MKKYIPCSLLLALLVPILSGCSAVGSKNTSLSIIYGTAAVLSVLLLIGYFCLIRERNSYFILLFSSVTVVNIGYFALSVSATLKQALLANRISYLGSVMLPFSMLMIILGATNARYKKWLPYVLTAVNAIVFFIAASPGYLDIYYKEVAFVIVNGTATLQKVYGPLHPLYLVFLLGYFTAMVVTIIRATVKKRINSAAHSVILLIAVLVNIGVWFIEQLSDIDFEFLSISYIISELFLLGVHLVASENKRLQSMIKEQDIPVSQQTTAHESTAVEMPAEQSVGLTEQFLNGMKTLTPKERELFDAYVAGKTTKDILVALNIKENTLKFHNKNLYGKLGVTSRKQLVAVYRQIVALESASESHINE